MCQVYVVVCCNPSSVREAFLPRCPARGHVRPHHRRWHTHDSQPQIRVWHIQDSQCQILVWHTQDSQRHIRVWHIQDSQGQVLAVALR